MKIHINWNSFAWGVIFCLILDFVLSLAFSSFQQVKNQWVTTGGDTVSAHCVPGPQPDIVGCVCDVVNVSTPDNIEQIEFMVQDSVLSGFLRDDDTVRLCDEYCVKDCFARTQLQ